MYTTKEIQNMMQIDTVVAKTKEIAEQSIAFGANITHQNIVFFDKMTDGKFTTYTEQLRKGVDKFAETTTEFVQTGNVPQIYGFGSKN